ncbi:hypothetical protein [Lysobacter sp. A3-1-A15]
MLYLAALLVALLGLAHSVLGERYILVRLFRRDLPKLFGGPDFTRRTLRFAWHLTTLLAWTLAALLVQIAGPHSPSSLAASIGWALLACGLLPLVITRGRHISWLVLFAAGALCLAWAAQ